MKPNPFASLNHFTEPCAMFGSSPCGTLGLDCPAPPQPIVDAAGAAHRPARCIATVGDATRGRAWNAKLDGPAIQSPSEQSLDGPLAAGASILSLITPRRTPDGREGTGAVCRPAILSL